MFLSGTILRQIAHPSPALTRPARRSDLEKLGFRPAMRRHQCCPEASQDCPVSGRPDLCQPGQPGRFRATTTRQAASAAPVMTGQGRARARRPLTQMRSRSRTVLARTVLARTVLARTVLTRPVLTRPVRGRRDGQHSAQTQARGRATDCAWAVLRHGSPGRPARCQAAAQRMRCDVRVTASRSRPLLAQFVAKARRTGACRAPAPATPSAAGPGPNRGRGTTRSG